MIKTKLSALERARADLAAGRPDLARDRVHGYLYTLASRGEYSQETYLLLGEILFSMRDYARAGAAWMLTERDDADAQAAFDAFRKRFGNTKTRGLEVVKPHAPSESYPPKVQERLLDWKYRYAPYRSRTRTHETADPEEAESKKKIRPIEAGCIMAVLFGIFLVGSYLYIMIFGRS